MMNSQLPSGFEALESFVAKWAMDGSVARANMRRASSTTDKQEFYDVAKDHLPSALALLDLKPVDQLDRAERSLLNLMLSLAHVSLAVEIQREHEPQLAVQAQHMPITRSTAGA